MTHELLMLLVGLVLTVGTGMFVAAEFALVNLDRHDVEQRRDRGETRLGPTITALKITSTHLSSAQLGITLTTLLTGYTFEPAMSSLLEEPLGSLGLEGASVSATGAIIGVLLATVMSMIIGELVPKNVALAIPLATAKAVIPFQAAFTAIFRPVIVTLNGTANAIIRSMGVEPKEELSGARSAEELQFLIRHSATHGLLEASDAQLLERTLRFAARDAGDVMTPRVEMTAVPADGTAADVLAASAESGHSRFPVIGEDNDDVRGLVHVKHAYALEPAQWATTPVAELMSEPVQVPDTMDADSLLAALRGRGMQLAIVVDEYGGTAGLVTLEDLVEEIVGEVEDEFDEAPVEVLRDGESLAFDASWRPDEVLDRTGIDPPESDEWETAGGFVTAELGRLPEVGDLIELPAGQLQVDELDGARIVRLRYLPQELAGQEEES